MMNMSTCFDANKKKFQTSSLDGFLLSVFIKTN